MCIISRVIVKCTMPLPNCTMPVPMSFMQIHFWCGTIQNCWLTHRLIGMHRCPVSVWALRCHLDCSKRPQPSFHFSWWYTECASAQNKHFCTLFTRPPFWVVFEWSSFKLFVFMMWNRPWGTNRRSLCRDTDHSQRSWEKERRVVWAGETWNKTCYKD